jgi:hypothetical protein
LQPFPRQSHTLISNHFANSVGGPEKAGVGRYSSPIELASRYPLPMRIILDDLDLTEFVEKNH